MRVKSLAKAFVLFAWIQAAAGAEEVVFRIRAVDGQSAQVSVEKQVLGKTGEDLTFDTTGYPEPVYLDIVLSRPGAIPTLHTLPVEVENGRWEPEPLGLCQPVNPIHLRTEPSAETVFRENRDGQLIPAGKDALLMLSTGVVAPRQAFVPQEVVVVLQSPGYQAKRITLPASVWFAKSYPASGQPPLVLEPAYGLSAWWTRTGSQNLGLLLATVALAGLCIGLLRLRYHYLRQIEESHKDLSLWVDRLNTFVDGSRELATPVKVEDLVELVKVQARRLTACEWEWIEIVDPDFRCLETEVGESAQKNVVTHLSGHSDRPLHLGKVAESTFSEMADVATSILALPLRFKNQYRGFVLVASHKTSAFSETDREALGVLCFQLAGTVERLRLHAETVEAYQKLAESEAQLVESAKMAAVGQLAAGVAHELNSPLNAINLGIQMAQRNLAEKPQIAEKRLGLAATATQRASDIVAKLLYFSREGLQDSQKVSLNSLWDDALALVKLDLRQDDITVERQTDLEQTIVANQTELIQVLSGLILNARDAIVRGTDISRKIRVESILTERGLELSVIDWADGVSDEIKSRIFEPFFTTKNMGDGTGLSLSVNQKIAERHGGQILLTSPSHPTKFTLLLPLPNGDSETALTVEEPNPTDPVEAD